SASTAARAVRATLASAAIARRCLQSGGHAPRQHQRPEASDHDHGRVTRGSVVASLRGLLVCGSLRVPTSPCLLGSVPAHWTRALLQGATAPPPPEHSAVVPAPVA